MSRCNYCLLQQYKKEAKKRGNMIITRPSNFMGGTCVFEIPKNIDFVLDTYIEPKDKYPNGNKIYQKFNVGWMMSIPDKCEC